jgi:hypothetical protein
MVGQVGLARKEAMEVMVPKVSQLLKVRLTAREAQAMAVTAELEAKEVLAVSVETEELAEQCV